MNMLELLGACPGLGKEIANYIYMFYGGPLQPVDFIFVNIHPFLDKNSFIFKNFFILRTYMKNILIFKYNQGRLIRNYQKLRRGVSRLYIILTTFICIELTTGT